MTTENNSTPLPVWPPVSQYRRSIGREFALFVGGLVVLLMLVTGLIVTNKLVTTVTEHVVDKIVAQARSYAGAAAKQVIAADGPDVLMLTAICKNLMADNPDCAWVGVADVTGQPLAHTDMRVLLGEWQKNSARPSRKVEGLREGEVIQVTNDSIFVAVPIVEQGVLLGKLALATSADQIAQVRHSALITMALITFVMTALGVPLTAMILRRRLRPIHLITESLRQVESGNLSLDPPVSGKNEFGFLADTLRVMGTRLKVAQQQAVETDRMTRELEIAREIQANILPKSYPVGSRYQLAGTYRSARAVGGDYYDFIDLGTGRLGIVIADVSGKSLPGMLVMLLTRDLVNKHARRCAGPSELLSAVNKELLPEIRKGMFVTMFYGILDTTAGEFSFASAGHNPLIHVGCNSGQQQLIKTKGYPLGMMNAGQFDTRIESSQIHFSRGDWCILFTDGINEAMDKHSNEYGMERFLAAVHRNAALTAKDLVLAVTEDVSSFVGNAPQADDITLLALRWAGQSAEVDGQLSEKDLYATSR